MATRQSPSLSLWARSSWSAARACDRAVPRRFRKSPSRTRFFEASQLPATLSCCFGFLLGAPCVELCRAFAKHRVVHNRVSLMDRLGFVTDHLHCRAAARRARAPRSRHCTQPRPVAVAARRRRQSNPIASGTHSRFAEAPQRENLPRRAIPFSALRCSAAQAHASSGGAIIPA